MKKINERFEKMFEKSGGPVFPYETTIGEANISYSGICLRQFFAGMAMQALIAKDVPQDYRSVAEWSVGYADALIEQLKKEAR